MHLSSTSCRCCSYLYRNCCFEETALDLWWRVFTTLYFAEMAWLLFHSKYCSVWMGFLYTVVARVPSGCGRTSVSEKCIESSGLVSSIMNWMHMSIELICWRKLVLWDDFWTTSVSSTYLLHSLWGISYSAESLNLKVPHLEVCHYGTYWWPYSCPLQLLKTSSLEQKISVLQKNCSMLMMLPTDIDVFVGVHLVPTTLSLSL